MNYKSALIVVSMLISAAPLFSACPPCLSREERKMKDLFKAQLITEYAARKNGGKVDAKTIAIWQEKSERYGLDLNRPVDNEGKTLLMYAAMTGHLTPVRHLRKEGVDMNKVDSNGHNAIYHARSVQDQRMVDYLKKYGARDNKNSKN